MRGRRRVSSGAKSRPKRDVTWGFFFNPPVTYGPGGFFSQWIAAPARALPAATTQVPNIPGDSTLIRMLPLFVAATVTAANASNSIHLGIIAWGGTDADVNPTQFPAPSDGAWDWIWRMPLIATGPPGAGFTTALDTIGAPVWTDIHAQRKFGVDMGLLFVVDTTFAASDWRLGWDVRYAVKLPW